MCVFAIANVKHWLSASSVSSVSRIVTSSFDNLFFKNSELFWVYVFLDCSYLQDAQFLGRLLALLTCQLWIWDWKCLFARLNSERARRWSPPQVHLLLVSLHQLLVYHSHDFLQYFNTHLWTINIPLMPFWSLPPFFLFFGLKSCFCITSLRSCVWCFSYSSLAGYSFAISASNIGSCRRDLLETSLLDFILYKVTVYSIFNLLEFAQA